MESRGCIHKVPIRSRFCFIRPYYVPFCFGFVLKTQNMQVRHEVQALWRTSCSIIYIYDRFHNLQGHYSDWNIVVHLFNTCHIKLASWSTILIFFVPKFFCKVCFEFRIRQNFVGLHNACVSTPVGGMILKKQNYYDQITPTVHYKSIIYSIHKVCTICRYLIQ